MKLLLGSWILASMATLGACASQPPTPEQAAALADKENCQEVTGSRLRRCGSTALRDAGVKTMDAEAARAAIGTSSSGSGRSESGGR
jgi:hypothetical protein